MTREQLITRIEALHIPRQAREEDDDEQQGRDQ
jgi:hypothetical protein